MALLQTSAYQYYENAQVFIATANQTQFTVNEDIELAIKHDAGKFLLFVNEVEVDRNALAETIMRDKGQIEKLNLIIMPIIEAEMDTDEKIFIEANGAVIKDYAKRILVKADPDILAKRMKDNMPNLNDEFIHALIAK